jgi:hypothetical protein
MKITRKNNTKFSNLKYGDVFIWDNEFLAVKIFDEISPNNALSLNSYMLLNIDEDLDVVKIKSTLIIE